MFNVHRGTIGRLWRAQIQKLDLILTNRNGEPGDPGNLEPSDVIFDIDFYVSGKIQRGRKKKWDIKEVKNEVRSLGMKERNTWRNLSQSVGIPCTTLHDLYKTGKVFRRYRSSLKPYLTEENKLARLLHALEEVDLGTVDRDNETGFYKDFYDCVDVDEKWFYLTKEKENYILTIADDDDDNDDDADKENEAPRERKVKSRNHITKVMFLCAQARPR